MTSNSYQRPLSQTKISTEKKPPTWKQTVLNKINKLQIRSNNCFRNVSTLFPSSFLTWALIPASILLILVIIYLIGLLHRSKSLKYFLSVLLWVGAEMLWLILSWGLVAAICYFALNHLGTTQVENGTTQSRQNQSTVPSATSTSNNDWTNEVLTWMYNNFHKVPAPLEAWIKSLNDAAKKVTSPSKCEVLFESFGDHSNVINSPKISNLRVEHGPRDHLTLRSNVHLPCVRLKLVTSQRTADRLVVSNMNASIVDLRGEVECRIASIANQLFLMGCFNGRPEMDIELQNTDPNAQTQVSYGMVEESIRRCLLSAVTNINLSEALPQGNDLWRADSSLADSMNQMRNNNQTSSFDHHTYDHASNQQASNLFMNVNHGSDYNNTSSNSSTKVPELFKKLNETRLISPTMNASLVPNKLRVKVIKASRLGKGSLGTDVQQPFVVIEMDEPAQRYTTSKGINASPYWEETYSFDLTPASEEILFEVYEGNGKVSSEDDKNFLGLSIVNFEEIRRSGEQIHALRLQGRPYRNDTVSGDLTIQFDFYYDPASVSAGKVVDSVRIKDQKGTEFKETVTTERRAIYDPHDNFDSNDITPSRTTTLVVKTVSQQLKEKPTIQSVHGSLENAVDPVTQKILDQRFKSPNDEKMRQLEDKLQQAAESQDLHRYYRTSSSDDANVHAEIPETSDRGRDRTKKSKGGEKRERSFFGELRDRLSGRRRSQKRSKSVDVNSPEIEEAVSLPPSRDPSRTRYAVSDNQSRYTETQSVGGRSGESSKSLYQHSTLVLELEHEKQQKYFLIPPSMLSEPSASKLMKRGKKLHIYNDHTFVAVKIRGGANCNVCQQRIKSSFSKQAYQCRDCKLVCHKSCHYKTDAFCTQSTVSKLEIARDVDWAHFLSHYQLEEFISLEGV